VDHNGDGKYDGEKECGDKVRADGFDATIIDRSIEDDILVLAAPLRTGRTPTFVPSRSYSIGGEQVFSIGFPNGVENVIARGRMSANISLCGILLSLETGPGASGSPIFAASDGSLLGFVEGFAHRKYVEEGVTVYRRYTTATNGRCLNQRLQAVRAEHPVLPLQSPTGGTVPAVEKSQTSVGKRP
jgi:hypothetical protein